MGMRVPVVSVCVCVYPHIEELHVWVLAKENSFVRTAG